MVLIMIPNVYDFEPATVVRNHVGGRVENVDCKFYTKIFHLPFL